MDPIEIISTKTKAKDSIYKDEFLITVKKCYQYEILKPFMDLAATICMKNRLQFEITPQEYFTLDEGNCKTFRQGAGHTFIITIRKISADVVIHEIAHMLEREAHILLDNSFKKALQTDITSTSRIPTSLQLAIRDIIVLPVRQYPENQRDSELFVRFFELLSLSKEVTGFTANYGYNIVEFYQAFPKMSDWLVDECYPKFQKSIDNSIAKNSAKYIIPIDQIKHKWAGEKIASFHGAEGKSKNWTRSFKSNKDW